MSDPIVPIREGVVPETDYGRELLDFCNTKIVSFTEEYDTPPTSVALVLHGERDGKKFTDGCSWDVTETRSRLETCSLASAILLKRAIDL